MWTIFARTLKDRWLTLLIYCGTGFIFLWMFASIYPSFASKGEGFVTMVKSYPEGLLKAFGVEMTSFTTSFDAFLSTENFSFMWPIMAILISVGYGASSLAGEIEKGTMEIMLSLPVSRLKIFIGKYLAGLSGIIIFVLFTIPMIYPFAKLYKVNSQIENVLVMTGLSFLFCWVIFALTMFFSAIFSEKGKANMAVIGIILPMYALNLIASLKENLDFLKYFSFFYYFNQNDALLRHTISRTSLLVFGLTIVVATLAAAFCFKKRDAAV